MRLSSAFTLPHPDVLRSLATRIAWGEAAKEFDSRAEVILLPHHARMPAGEAYINWVDSGGIVTLPESSVSWSLTERGTKYYGVATVHADGDFTGAWPPAVHPVPATAGDAVASGALALWELVKALEPHVVDALAQANRYVARELEGREGDDPESLAATLNHGAVDRVALDHIAAEMLFGNSRQRANRPAAGPTVKYSERDAPVAAAFAELADIENGELEATPERIAELELIASCGLKDRPTVCDADVAAPSKLDDSVIVRMAKRTAQTPINNQPLGSWWAINIRARAEERIRQHIGDPHVGPKVRRFATEFLDTHSETSVEELLAAYRIAHPRDRVGHSRLVAAMSAGKTIDSTSHSLSLLVDVPTSGGVE